MLLLEPSLEQTSFSLDHAELYIIFQQGSLKIKKKTIAHVLILLLAFKKYSSRGPVSFKYSYSIWALKFHFKYLVDTPSCRWERLQERKEMLEENSSMFYNRKQDLEGRRQRQ